MFHHSRDWLRFSDGNRDRRDFAALGNFDVADVVCEDRGTLRSRQRFKNRLEVRRWPVSSKRAFAGKHCQLEGSIFIGAGNRVAPHQHPISPFRLQSIVSAPVNRSIGYHLTGPFIGHISRYPLPLRQLDNATEVGRIFRYFHAATNPDIRAAFLCGVNEDFCTITGRKVDMNLALPIRNGVNIRWNRAGTIDTVIGGAEMRMRGNAIRDDGNARPTNTRIIVGGSNDHRHGTSGSESKLARLIGSASVQGKTVEREPRIENANPHIR